MLTKKASSKESAIVSGAAADAQRHHGARRTMADRSPKKTVARVAHMDAAATGAAHFVKGK